MIATLVRVAWTNLRRDRAAQLLVFVVPIAFFSIFAVIFGGRGNFSTSRLSVAVVDESHTGVSRALVAALAADSSLNVRTTAAPVGGGAAAPLDRARAEQMVRDGDAPVAMVLPAGVDSSLGRFDGRGPRITLVVDPGDPVARQMAIGLLQRATLTLLRTRGWPGVALPGTGVDDLMPARTEVEELHGRQRGPANLVAFYAAGIAVMFLMFSASGAGGALIEETESGTLERVLTTGAGMGTLLLAKGLYILSLGCVQITVMFLWGALVFRLPLAGHLTGFAVMTVATAACAAAFGLVLATAARTRQQLAGLANLIVLSLSAIGGSMFPRFLMGPTLQRLSLVGFNAWALDGYQKVFWRDATVAQLTPQLGALAAFTLAFAWIARRLARRWESA